MGATADNDTFTVFFNNKILFVEEIIRDEFAFNQFVQTVGVSKVFCFAVVAVEQGNVFGKLDRFAGKNEARVTF